jgi:hypothetical protein
MKKIFLLFVLLSVKLHAQFNDFQPDYNWLTISTEHAYVHYHEEAERTAKVVAKIIEDVWEPITSLYEYEPEKVHFVIKDIDDYSNGATYFFDNKIEIWASALDFDLRGDHNWLRNVISHEFTHMVQIQAGMKLSRNLPAFYFQFLNYEEKRRSDILYGFPNVIVSYPVPSINIPAWFAEGTAQYMRKDFDYDNWDSHRDMILRSYVLDDKMLTWNQMGIFNKTSLGNESVYNSGFALTRYISQKYGEDKLREITKELGKLTVFTFDAAVKNVLGIDGQELYDEWKNYLKKSYAERIKPIMDNPVIGEQIIDEGFGNFYPVFSADGKSIFYISNAGSDYFNPSHIMKYEAESKEKKIIAENIRSAFSFYNNDKKIVYSKLSEDNPKWINIHDLYTYDIESENEERITFGLRANNPSVSNKEDKICFVFQKDGTSNIGMINIDGSGFKQLTFFVNGEQVYNPKFSKDDSFVIFDYSYHHGRDIAKVEINEPNKVEFIIKTESDERNPVFDKEGNIVFASDESGIFNIYRYNIITGEKTQVTNVLGGAFMPAFDQNENLVYAGYTSGGYKIFLLNKELQKPVRSNENYIKIQNPPLDADQPKGDITKFNLQTLKYFNDKEPVNFESKPYKGFFSRWSFFPFIRYDNYNTSSSVLNRFKPGVYITSSDYLNRYSVFGGLSINKLFERDAFLSFEYRNKLPLLFSLGIKPQITLELYSISRKTNVDLFFNEYVDSNNVTRYDSRAKTDVTYNLFEFDFAANHKIFAEGNNLELRFIYSQYTATLGSFVIPNTSSLYPTSDDKYLVGRNIQVKFNHNSIKPAIDSDINPIGRTFELKYNYEINDFNNKGEYTVNDGILKAVYNKFNFHRLELNWDEHYRTWKNQTFNIKLRAGTIFGPRVPDFFDFYLGGLVGMKSYPFYAISGNEIGWLNFTYRFPLFENIDYKLGHLYFDKTYLSVYADLGNAWTGKFPALNDFKKGIGMELRLKMNSFYLFPTSIFVSAAYSIDKYERTVQNKKIVYGKEIQLYGGILFDFNF